MELYLQRILVFLIVVCVEKNLASNNTQPENFEDEPIRFMERVKFHGYTAEKHQVVSADGYNLILHRISGGPNNPPTAGKKVIYVQHGLLMSTDNFVINGPGIDFVYLLVDAGYDVWLGNCRGNLYSRSHESLMTVDEKFWDFSYHEVAVYDIKAFVDYMLEVTKQEKFVYIGFSLGTTKGYVFFSQLPEYNEKASLIVSLGTVALWHNNNNILVKAAGLITKHFENLNGALKIYEFAPQLQHIGPATTEICDSSNIFVKLLCRVLVSIMIPRMKFDRVPEGSLGRMLQTFPAGTSTKNLFHLGQNIRNGDFTLYDYGILNEQKYGNKTVPKYPLEKVIAPVAIYLGQNDLFGNAEDILALKNSLPNVVEYKEIDDKDFSHFDVVLNGNAKDVLFNDFISLIIKLH